MRAKACVAGKASAVLVRAATGVALAAGGVRSNVNQCNRPQKFLYFSYICFALYDRCMFDWNFIAGLVATVAFDIIYFGAIIGTITVIILDNRNPVKTMAWILILMFLPLVGLVLYFFFGRSQRRVRVIGKKSYNRLLKKPMAEYLAQDSCTLPVNYSRLISLFRNTSCRNLYAWAFHASSFAT